MAVPRRLSEAGCVRKLLEALGEAVSKRHDAPCHTARTSQAFLSEQPFAFLPKEGGSGNLPDLNPIVWAVLQQRVNARQPQNPTEFQKILTEGLGESRCRFSAPFHRFHAKATAAGCGCRRQGHEVLTGSEGFVGDRLTLGPTWPVGTRYFGGSKYFRTVLGVQVTPKHCAFTGGETGQDFCSTLYVSGTMRVEARRQEPGGSENQDRGPTKPCPATCRALVRGRLLPLRNHMLRSRYPAASQPSTRNRRKAFT